MCGSKGVPKSRVGIKVAVVHLSIVWAEIGRPSLRANLVKFMWKQNGTVERAIKCPLLIQRAAFDTSATQHFIPAIIRALMNGLEIRFTDFLLQISHRLFRTDERRRHFAPNYRPILRCELHVYADVISCELL